MPRRIRQGREWRSPARRPLRRRRRGSPKYAKTGGYRARSMRPAIAIRAGRSMISAWAPALDQLLSAVIAEQKRRCKKLAPKISEPRRVEVVRPLTPGKLNAVRAAFKAGVTPSRIARQFGISQSDVRKALASDIAKR